VRSEGLKAGGKDMEKPHKKLKVWSEAVSLVLIVYKVVKTFPRAEEFGLISQIKRAVVSIAANIAEGAARQSRRELIQFLYIARGSLSELDTCLEIAKQLGYVAESGLFEIEQKMDLVDKMLSGLIASLKRTVRDSSPLTPHASRRGDSSFIYPQR
jgi:four helix bundle protein